MIRDCQLDDAVAIAEIYNHYIQNSVVTFEEQLVSGEEMESRIAKIIPKFPWLVFEDAGEVVGYAYASEFRERSAFRYTTEASIYLAPNYAKKGIGEQLYRELIKRLTSSEIKSIIGVVALPNDLSAKLHNRLGFQHCGVLKNAGYKFEQWVDIEFWQLML